MKRIIYVLLFVSPLMNACIPWCCAQKKKNVQQKQIIQELPLALAPQSIRTAHVLDKEADKAHLNDQLFRAVNDGQSDIVQQLIDAKADVNAVDSVDKKSSTSKAAASLLIAYAKRENKKSNAYTTIIAALKEAGAVQREDLRPFMNKEPFKSRYIRQIIAEHNCNEQEAEDALNRIVQGLPLTIERSEK